MAAPQLPSPPRAPPAGPGPRPPWLSPPLELGPEPATCPRWAAVASCAAASVGEWSALEFEQGPEPSQRHLRFFIVPQRKCPTEKHNREYSAVQKRG